MMFAAGPWIRSEDKPPPKDGRQILGTFPDGIYVVRWEDINDDEPAWTMCGTPFQSPDDPIAWAEIRPYQEEKP